MKLRLIYSKTGLIRFTSHRDLMRILFRSFSRIELPIRYSEGYSPHPRVTFCPPLKVGMEGFNEVIEIHLTELVETDEIIVSLNDVLPVGMKAEGAFLPPEDSPSLGKLIREVEYRVYLSDSVRVTDRDIEEFMAKTEVPLEYVRKGKIKIINIRRGVEQLEYAILDGERESLNMLLSLDENNRPYDVLATLSGVEREYLVGLRWQRLGFYLDLARKAFLTTKNTPNFSW